MGAPQGAPKFNHNLCVIYSQYTYSLSRNRPVCSVPILRIIGGILPVGFDHRSDVAWRIQHGDPVYTFRVVWIFDRRGIAPLDVVVVYRHGQSRLDEHLARIQDLDLDLRNAHDVADHKGDFFTGLT